MENIYSKTEKGTSETPPSKSPKDRAPIYKNWGFWVVIVVIFIGFMSVAFGEDAAEEETSSHETQIKETLPDEVEYFPVSVSELVRELDENALKAKDDYLKKKVEITGRVEYIDSDGKYINLYPTNDVWGGFVQCYISGKEQKEFVKGIKNGDVVTLRGKIIAVDEIFGADYELDVHEFVK